MKTGAEITKDPRKKSLGRRERKLWGWRSRLVTGGFLAQLPRGKMWQVPLTWELTASRPTTVVMLYRCQNLEHVEKKRKKPRCLCYRWIKVESTLQTRSTCLFFSVSLPSPWFLRLTSFPLSSRSPSFSLSSVLRYKLPWLVDLGEQRETGKASTVQGSGELGQAAAINHRLNPSSRRTAVCQVTWSTAAEKYKAYCGCLNLNRPSKQRLFQKSSVWGKSLNVTDVTRRR